MEVNNVNDNLIDDATTNQTGNKKKKVDRILTLILCVCVFLMAVLIFINKFVFVNVYVEGQSMYPTLTSGDVLFAYQGNDAEVGDIVVIDGEKANGKGGYDLLIKRIIAIGQKDKTIIVEIKDGKVYVGDSDQTLQELKEDYLPEGTFTFSIAPEFKTRWELAEGEVFYLGDNRSHSSDSRYMGYDVCKKSQIIGIVPEWALSMRWLSGFLFSTGQFFSNLF